MSSAVAAVCGWNWLQSGECSEAGRGSVASLGLLPPPAAEQLQDEENEHQWWPCAEKCCFSFVHSSEGDLQTLEPARCTHNKVNAPHLLLVKLGPRELQGADGRQDPAVLNIFYFVYSLAHRHGSVHTPWWRWPLPGAVLEKKYLWGGERGAGIFEGWQHMADIITLNQCLVFLFLLLLRS